MAAPQQYMISTRRKLPDGRPDVMGGEYQNIVSATSFADALARARVGDRFVVTGIQGPGGQWWNPNGRKPPPRLDFLSLAGFGAVKTEAELQAELAALWEEVDALTARRAALPRSPTAPAWPRLKLEKQLAAVFAKIDRANRQLAARVARKRNLKMKLPG